MTRFKVFEVGGNGGGGGDAGTEMTTNGYNGSHHASREIPSMMENNYNKYVERKQSQAGQPAAQPINDPRKFSLAVLTREALPRLDNYRLSFRALKRPSLGELYGEPEQKPEDVENASENGGGGGHGIKLGWIQGVLVPCLLNIWGVMLFLRVAWVVSLSGVGQTLLIILISYSVCFVTTLSLSAICTNGEVKGGGIYYIISRSLGPEFGASVGIIFALANAVAASMNTIGFCDSLNDLLASYKLQIIDGGVNDTRIIGTIAILVMVIICAVGMDWESKAQNFLVVVIVAAIINFIIGVLMGPKSLEDQAKGQMALNVTLFKENWKPDYRFSEGLTQNFFSVFAIFFPSVTGIQAGANISGDLKDPAKSIPKGTLLALFLSCISYVLFAVLGGFSAMRDASGSIADLQNGNLTQCVADLSCNYGLHNDYSVMQLLSAWAPGIYVGCFAATLSTALTNLLSVPRLIQALGIDQIYPGLIFFSKGYGKHGEPYRGYVLTFFVATAFLLIAKLNVIAPLISTFYLASYALINYCTFHAARTKPLGWRPTFKFYNVWLSLFGFIACVVIMFLIDWKSSIITIGIVFTLYMVVVYRKPDVNWGSSTQAQTYKTALSAALKLQTVSDHVKNYHPQILVLAGKPFSRAPLVDFANLITKNNSLMIVGNVESDKLDYKNRKRIQEEGNRWLAARKIKAFYNVVDDLTLEDGVKSLMQLSGFGKFTPNIVMMGYKADWQKCKAQDLKRYFGILHTAFSNRVAVAILRLPTGVDFSHLQCEISSGSPPSYSTPISMNNSEIDLRAAAGPHHPPKPRLLHVDSNLHMDAFAPPNQLPLTAVPSHPIMNPKNKHLKDLNSSADIVYLTANGSAVPQETLAAMNVFQVKKPKGTIDVWWLYDDGGLTMLVPYIISLRSNWANCKVRVFALANRTMILEEEKNNMSKLLKKLRVDYSALIMLQGVTDPPKDTSLRMHEKMLYGFLEGQNTECFISDEERSRLQGKTNIQLRLRELLLEHSKNAALVVMSLPMPRQDTVSAPLYLSWLELLTKDMPPMLLVRGNQTSVMTFYS